MPAFMGRRGSGLMGLGADADDQSAIKVGERAKSDPILSTASVIASEILVKISLVPKDKRLAEMRKILNAGEPGMGDRAVQEYQRLWTRRGEGEKDQTMFDVVRSEVANLIVKKTFQMAKSQPMSGLGQTIAEASGRTSQGVNDANALFCSFGAGGMAMVGGITDQFGLRGGSGSSAGTAGSITGGAVTGGRIAGCNAGQMVLQNQNAQAMATIAQQGTAQQLALQAQAEAAREARFQRMLLLGGGGVVALVAIGLVLRK